MSFSEGPAPRGTVTEGAGDGEVDLGRPGLLSYQTCAVQRWTQGHAVQVLQQRFSVGDGLLFHLEDPDAHSSPLPAEPAGESGLPCGFGGILKGMTMCLDLGLRGVLVVGA